MKWGMLSGGMLLLYMEPGTDKTLRRLLYMVQGPIKGLQQPSGEAGDVLESLAWRGIAKASVKPGATDDDYDQFFWSEIVLRTWVDGLSVYHDRILSDDLIARFFADPEGKFTSHANENAFVTRGGMAVSPRSPVF